MSSASDRKSLLIIFSVFFFVIASTYLVSLIARGYRPDIKPNGITISATGLLSATSRPKGASVYLDDKLITATDDTLNLTPGSYVLKIAKDGYFPWQKEINIKKEVVFQSDAELFRSSPDFTPITTAGAINPTISPDLTKIIFSVASASATANNGLYLIDLNSGLIPLTKNTPRQIAPNYPNINWSRAEFTFSPNSRQIIASFPSQSTSYLLDLNTTITSQSLQDVTANLNQIKISWHSQNQEIIDAKLQLLPPEISAFIATDSSKNIFLNQTADQVLYLAKKSGQLKDNIISSPPPARSTQIETRNIQTNNWYVYHLKDDTNFLVGSSTDIHNPFWIPNSSNVLYTNGQDIFVTDSDGTNRNLLFSGDIALNHIYPWPDGNKIITLLTPYPGSSSNLYSITIR